MTRGPAGREQGSVSVVVVGVLGVAVVLAGVVGQVGAVAAARQRASSAADLAALASVDGGCTAALALARKNGARVIACDARGDQSVVVTVGVIPAGPVGRLTGALVMAARAGPPSAPPGRDP